MMSSRPVLLVVSMLLAACSGSSTAAAPGDDSPDGSAPTTPPPSSTSDAGADSAAPDADAAAPSGSYFPPPAAMNTWETVTAAQAGFDPTKLDDVSTFVQQSNSTTFMMLYDGRILVEKYWAGSDATTLRDIASAQKSVLSMLAGKLIAAGMLSYTDTVTSVLGAGWSNATAEQEAPITIRQILTMTSGLDANLGYAAPAGSTWLYNTDAYHRNGLVVEAKTGMTLEAYTKQVMFDPIGVGTSTWSTRGMMKDSKGMPVASLDMNARDMARVGLLMMHRGQWQDQIITPASYMADALVTSQTFNPSYGLLFWLNGQSSALLPPAQPYAGSLMPSAPPDLVAALGADDQKIHASTSAKIVVVRQGPSAGPASQAASAWDELLWQHIVAAEVK